MQLPNLRLSMSVIYVYGGVLYIYSYELLFFLLFSKGDWKAPVRTYSYTRVNNQKVRFFLKFINLI